MICGLMVHLRITKCVEPVDSIMLMTVAILQSIVR